jgi:UDP-3-O-[3-hydroxymyristoyl] glucosamine N-acyltransferase
MPDPRFFEDLGPVTLGELAQLTGAELSQAAAEGRTVRGVAILSQAQPETVTFLADRKHAPDTFAAAACFVQSRNSELLPADCVALLTSNPQGAYARAAQRLHRARLIGPGPAVADDVELEVDVVLAPGVILGPGVRVGRGTRIGAGTVVGPGVAIGRDCQISPNVTISCALIGDRVKILAGAVIGEAGFGATAGPSGLIDIPQLGRVILQDGVTIGANSTVDRGAFDDTILGENTKIDNLVMIGHNVRVGRNTVMASQTGISGSVIIGDGCQLGGRVGIADHVTVGDGARLGANAGVIGNIPAGETWGGFPAQPIRNWLREAAWVRRMSSRKGSAE